MQQGKRAGVMAIIISTLGFCVYPIFGKVVFAGGASVFTVLFIRFTLAAVVFWSLTWWKSGRPRLGLKIWLVLLGMGGMGYASMAALLLGSVHYIPASIASLIFYTFPLMVTVIAIATRQEIASGLKLLGLGSSSLGLILVIGLNFGGVNLMGALIAFSSAVVHALNVMIGNRVLRVSDPLLSTAGMTTGAAVSMGIASLATGLTWQLSATTWLGIAGITFFSTIIAMFSFYKGLQLVGASTASILSMLEPVMTGILAYLFLGERLTLTQLVGGALVLLGSMIVAWVPVPVPVSEKPIP
ncbi:EamA family transporter [Paradesulfitobacterium ferrireducens]|uniref:EamA family transporter n=1 Tax=Paradesulfitobacterium ferrireducens TaxID=2816476 RepID=UPI001F45598F|nr:DMT family transporter [Paradesulfitobacterium ferrireducens]